MLERLGAESIGHPIRLANIEPARLEYRDSDMETAESHDPDYSGLACRDRPSKSQSPRLPPTACLARFARLWVEYPGDL